MKHRERVVIVCGMSLVGFLAWHASRPVYIETNPVPVPEDIIVPTYTSSWTSNGETKAVKTTKKDDESDAEHAARHQAAVDALKAIYPPDQE